MAPPCGRGCSPVARLPSLGLVEKILKEVHAEAQPSPAPGTTHPDGSWDPLGLGRGVWGQEQVSTEGSWPSCPGHPRGCGQEENELQRGSRRQTEVRAQELELGAKPSPPLQPSHLQHSHWLPSAPSTMLPPPGRPPWSLGRAGCPSPPTKNYQS